tara:strand:- start:188 stop:370 length:183 start_codon:yes stop_codon:yes gene_type:complete
VEQPIDLFKLKIVQELTTELEVQFVLDPLVAEVCKIDLVSLPGHLEDPTVLIIVQVFHLA